MRWLAWGLCLLWLSPIAMAQSLSGPVGLAKDAQGRLVIAERGRSRVVRLDGTVVAEGVQAWGLIRIGDELACSEPSTGRILWLGAEGVAQLIGGLDRPTGMAFQDGSLYVVERRGRLLEVDPFAGVVKRVLTEELVGAEGIACSRTEAFVTLPASDRVVRVGLLDGAVSVVSEDLELPTGIAFGGHVVLVLSGETGQVVEVDLARPERRRVLTDLRAPGLACLTAFSLLPVPGHARGWAGHGRGSLRRSLQLQLFFTSFRSSTFQFDTA